MSCQHCTQSGAIKRMWGCGWVPARERKGARPPAPAKYIHERPQVCVGYLMEMPQVIEAARATGWRKEGAQREFYDGEPLTPLTKFAVDVMAGAMREVEQDRIRSQKEE